MPDTFDLDAAFRGLEADVGRVSAPLGAAAAITTSRRRRRTTVAAGAAAVVLLVGGVLLGHGLGSDRAVGPSDPLPPTPAPLTAERLTSATAGWTPAWAANTQAAQQKMSMTFGGDCFPSVPDVQTDGFIVFGNSHDDLGITMIGDLSGEPRRASVIWDRMVRHMKGCTGVHVVSSFTEPSGVAEYTYRVGSGTSDSAGYTWLVTTGQTVGVLRILGARDPLPSSDDRALADALVAAVAYRPSVAGR